MSGVGTKISTREVLKVIAAGGLIVGTGVLGPSLPLVLAGAVKVWKEVNKSNLGTIIKRLERQELISIEEKDNKISLQITEKGKRRLLEYDFENIEIKRKKRDGKWRIIIFDIPEGKKKNRDAFRRKLLQLDCVRLQDSVFVSAYPCKDEIDFLSNYLNISDFVTLLTVGKIERGEKLIFEPYEDPNWD